MPNIWSNILISFQISLIATGLAFVVGLPVAWVLSRPGWRGRSFVDILVNLPLALPPTVLGYYLLLLIGRDGPVGRLTKALWDDTLIFTPAAAVIASAVVCLPLLVQGARSALESVPVEVGEAAEIDGAGRLAAFRYVYAPVAWPGIWTGVLLAYARSLGEFGATLMVAGNIPGKTQTMSLAIYSAVQAGEDATAHVLALILTMIAGLSMWAGLRWRQPATAKPLITADGSR